MHINKFINNLYKYIVYTPATYSNVFHSLLYFKYLYII